jgi:tetratricopeptide (TPR) repeat protein
MSDNPLCFVLMPFGTKKDPTGGPDINFDSVYEQAIRPAIEAAGMDAIRADEELTGGIIHKPMFERLLLCDFALADLTTANPNVFYELGVRHAARPATTLAIFAKRQSIPFDVAYLRSLPYDLGEDNRFSADEASALRNALTRRLKELRQVALEDAASDSPIFQLLTDYGAPDIKRLKTDVFRDRIRYATEIKKELGEARERSDVDAVKAIEGRLGALDGIEAGVLVDLFLSYRAIRGYTQMVELYQKFPAVLRRSVTVREQLGFALNRLGKWREAISELEAVVQERGQSSETCGLLGRVYKDRWGDAKKAGNFDQAGGFLGKAIDAYVRGFEADWRDAYPGINAVTLLDIRGDEPSQKRKAEILPVVRFAVTQRLKSSKPDYWDYATLLELAVLEGDQEMSKQYLRDALANVRENWEPESTADNLKLIRDARQERGITQPWLSEIVNSLLHASKAA